MCGGANFLFPCFLNCFLTCSMLFSPADGKKQLLRIFFLPLSLFFKLSMSKISYFAFFNCKMAEMLLFLLQRFSVDIIKILFVHVFCSGLKSLQQESNLTTFSVSFALLMNNQAGLLERPVCLGDLLSTGDLTFSHGFSMKVCFTRKSCKMIRFLMVDFADEVDKTTDLGLFYHADKIYDLEN